MARQFVIYMTKVDLARVIICALYDLSALPAADDPRVIKRARKTRPMLLAEHKLALAAIQSRAA